MRSRIFKSSTPTPAAVNSNAATPTPTPGNFKVATDSDSDSIPSSLSPFLQMIDTWNQHAADVSESVIDDPETES